MSGIIFSALRGLSDFVVLFHGVVIINDNMKQVKSEKYKYVYRVTGSGRTGQSEYWKAYFTIKGQYHNSKLYTSEREAAIAVDRKLIEHGREPVNILKRL